MGEYADMAMDDALNGSYWGDYTYGNELDPEDDDYVIRRRKPIKCRQCGAVGLKWGQNPDTDDWELREADWSLHRCKLDFKSRIGRVKS